MVSTRWSQKIVAIDALFLRQLIESHTKLNCTYSYFYEYRKKADVEFRFHHFNYSVLFHYSSNSE